MMRAAMILLTMASLAAAAAPTRTVVVDIQKPEAPVALTVLQGATANVAFELRQNGKPYTDLAEHTAEFAFATTLTNTPRRVDSTTTDEANGRFVFQLSDEDTASAGRFAGILLITDGQTNTFFQGRVDLSVLASAFATGAGELDTGETVNWDGTSYENTATDGPYRAGTNVTFSANGDGSVAINASVTGGTGDVTGITSTDSSITVTSGTGPVPDVALPSNLPARNGSLLTALNASALASGTVPAARMGSGTANSSSYLRGDSTFANFATAVTNAVAGQTIAPIVILPNALQLELSSPEGTGILMTPDADSGVGVVEVSGGMTISGDLDAANFNATGTISGNVTDGSLSDTARTVVYHAGPWVGPKVTETPGWYPKSYALTGLTGVVDGPVGGATQAAATFGSVFQAPSDGTAWRTAKAVSISFIGDSTTSSVVKYRLYVYRAGSGTAVYDSGANQVLASSTAVTTIDLAGSSLGTFTADAVYSIVVEASVTTSGFYFVGTPRVQVIK